MIRFTKPCDECGGDGIRNIKHPHETGLDKRCPSCAGGGVSELITENTLAPVQCATSKTYWLLKDPLREQRCRCRLYMPHDGSHKGFISGIGWHAWLKEEGEE